MNRDNASKDPNFYGSTSKIKFVLNNLIEITHMANQCVSYKKNIYFYSFCYSFVHILNIEILH